MSVASSDATRREPHFVRGVGFALASAITFGASTPFIQKWGSGLGAFTIAALLYSGAAVANLVSRAFMPNRLDRDRALRAKDVPLIVITAILGTFIAPAALAWGLARTSGVSASLLLNMEAAFTIAFGRLFYREHVDARVITSASLIVAGSALVIWTGGESGGAEALGLIAVSVATLAWAFESALGRPLSERDLTRVIPTKSALGTLLSLGVAYLRHEPVPAVHFAILLFLSGVIGYGLSIRCYLTAQREFGAARTASVFSFAPFAAALVAFTMGQRIGGAVIFLALALMLVGVVLHATEKSASAAAT